MPDYTEFANQIRAQGYRMTPQRQIVLDAIAAFEGHASAADIYEWVQQHSPAINRATVYRVLNFLCDLQVVARFETGSSTMYELVGERPHHHLVCRGCGYITHIPDHALDTLAEALQQEYGFHAEFHHLAIVGLCAHCAAQVEG
ncbi:MAG: transcriptional repressor [Ardenticatenaceae bacterium]|nr:transcriptional repressor [Anaerolineales bacterium]MCB8923652.1 transcriptional repressor [Ardenticatenaceae bacterium]MCB8991871.1 transcriptional repressor [Ardenticatenaceae bacterium]MCB9005158.1 transcriptional repressor [Ardenticatenaceae bacterium]